MKCQKCGKEEVSFHYSSNINGVVTESKLCSQCASQAGYDFGHMFNRNALDWFTSLSDTESVYGMLPFRMLTPGFALAFPFLTRQDPRTLLNRDNCSCEKLPMDPPAKEIDEEMKNRREINALREQMRIAAQGDDFEKAIELREKIKEMEQ